MTNMHWFRGALAPAAAMMVMAGAAAGQNIDIRDAAELRAQLAEIYQPVENVREWNGSVIVRPKPAHQMLQGPVVRGQIASHARVMPLAEKFYPETGEYVVRVPNDADPVEFAATLMETGDYEYVEPNWTLFLSFTPNDPLFGQQYYQRNTRAREAWDISTGDPGITLAIVDSGVDLDDIEFAGRLVSGYNAYTNTAEIDGGNVDDDYGHGTNVAGAAAAQGNNGQGIAGVAWDVKIMPVSVNNPFSRNGSMSNILAGVRWAADNGARVVNASWSGVDGATVETTGEYVRDQNALLVWSAGNDNQRIVTAQRHVLVVGATNSSNNKSGFSNYGPTVDMVAPGSSILTTSNGNGYNYTSGTSFSSPIVAGAAALVLSVAPILTADDVEAILISTAADLGSPGEDDIYGAGLLNVEAALLAAQEFECYVDANNDDAVNTEDLYLLIADGDDRAECLRDIIIETYTQGLLELR